MIDNDEIAEKAIEDFGKIVEDSGLWEIDYAVAIFSTWSAVKRNAFAR